MSCSACLEQIQHEPAPRPAPALLRQLRYVLGPEAGGGGEGAAVCARCGPELATAYTFVRRCRAARGELQAQLAGLAGGGKLEVKGECFDFDYSNSLDPWDGRNKTDVKEERKENLADDTTVLDEFNFNLDYEGHDIGDKNIRKKNKSKIKSNRRPTCDICGATAQSPSALAIHLRHHTGERPFVCHHCALSFAQKSTLATHISRRHATIKRETTRNYKCELCDKRYATSSGLTVHIRSHTGEKPYACSMCPAAFAQIGPLLSHRRRHLGEKPYECVTCGNRFVDSTHLVRHQKVHSDERPFQCEMCTVRFKTSQALKTHLKTLHSDDKPYVCDGCGATFKTISNLSSHKNSLHSEKSGWCTLCSKCVPDLAEHNLRHSDEKTYSCSICQGKFSGRKGLAIHMRQHSIPRFPCSISGCPETFQRRWQLKSHLIKHSGCLPHACTYCHKAFLRPYQLRKHLQLNHSNEEKSIAT